MSDMLVNPSVATATAESKADAARVCHDEGVYYALLHLPGQVEPMRVILHGVTSALQAAKAVELFAPLRVAEHAAVAA